MPPEVTLPVAVRPVNCASSARQVSPDAMAAQRNPATIGVIRLIICLLSRKWDVDAK
jgi:hypothetical protein